MNLHWSWICRKGPTLFSVLGYCFSIWALVVQPHMIDDVKTLPIEVHLENKVQYLANLVFILNRKTR